MSLFFCLCGISLGCYCQKSLAKSGEFEKNIKRGMAIRGGLSIEKGFKPSAHYDIERLKGGTLEP